MVQWGFKKEGRVAGPGQAEARQQGRAGRLSRGTHYVRSEKLLVKSLFRTFTPSVTDGSEGHYGDQTR